LYKNKIILSIHHNFFMVTCNFFDKEQWVVYFTLLAPWTSFEMSNICSSKVKRVIFWFRLIKLVFNLKLKLFDHALLCLSLKNICSYTFSAFKVIKLTWTSFEMSKICSSEVKGVIVWYKLLKLVCNSKFKGCNHTYMNHNKCN